MQISLRLGMAAALFTLASVTIAELPPSAYAAMKAASPEVLTLRVGRFTTEPGDRVTHVSFDATVLAISKQTAAYKVGDVIRVTYDRRYTAPGHMPIVGASDVPLLQTWNVYSAYLKREGEGFVPSAGGKSFDDLDPTPFEAPTTQPD